MKNSIGGWTVLETCKELKVSKPTLYKLSNTGEIRSFKVGGSRRFDPEDVRDYKEKQKAKS